MNEAIRIAIEKGGFKMESWYYEEETGVHITEVIVLDPLFWQALGKALGWKERIYSDDEWSSPVWQYQAHQYLDLVLTGGDKEKFWEGLLE